MNKETEATKVVSMEFDNTRFEKNINKSLKSIDDLSNALKFKGATDGIENVNKSLKNVSLEPIINGVEKVRASMSLLDTFSFNLFSRISNRIIDVGKNMLREVSAVKGFMSGFSEYELKMNSVQTIMSSTGESIDTVNKYLQELNLYADKTIYSFSDMTSNIGKFTNSGVKLEDAVAAMKGISNEAAISGANANEASRAMYNLAQSLSMGYVQYIDWKSIENANMATQQFKENLAQVADEMKTIQKNSDGTFSIGNEVYTLQQLFKDALQKKWLTSDVLITTLKNYADEKTVIGEKATEAATKVKTLHQLLDTTKEAIQSGWAQTVEYIFGDLEEAKELFSSISSAIEDVLGKSADRRNDLVGLAVSEPYDILREKILACGLTMDGFLVALRTASGYTLDENIQSAEDLEAAMTDGRISGELLRKTLLSIADANSSGESYLSDDQIESLKKLSSQINTTGSDLFWLSENMDMVSGRTLLIESGKNVWKAFGKVIGAVKAGFQDVFPPATSQRLHSILEAVKNLTSKLIISDESADKLRRTVRGLASVLKLFKMVIDGGVNIAMTVLRTITGKTNIDILGLTARIGDLLTAFTNWVEENKFIEKSSQKISSAIVFIINKISALYNKIKESSVTRGIILGIYDALKSVFTGLKNNFAKTDFEGFVSYVKSIDSLSLSSIIRVFKEFKSTILDSLFDINISLDGFSERISSALSKVENSTKNFTNFVIGIVSKAFGYLTSINAEDVMSLGIAAAILDTFLMINKASRAIEGIYKVLHSGLKAINDILVSCNKILKAFKGVVNGFAYLEKSLATSMLLTSVTISIVALVGALVLLTRLPADRVKTVLKLLAELGVGIVIFMAALTALTKISDGNGVKVSIVGIALSIIALTTALILLKNISFDEIKTGLFSITVLLVAIIAAAKFMDTVKSNIIATGVGFVLMAVALKMLVNLITILSSMDKGKLENGVKAIATLITIMTVANIVASNDWGGAGTGFAKMSLALFLLAATIGILGKFKPETIQNGLTAIAELALVITIMSRFIKFGKNVDKLGKMMIKFSEAMIIMSVAILLIGKMEPDTVKQGTAVIAIFLAEMAALMVFIKDNGKNAEKAGKLMAKFSLCILAIAAAVTVMSILGGSAGKIFASGFAISLVFGVFAKIVELSEHVRIDNVRKVQSLMIALSTCMLVMAATFGAVLYAVSKATPGELLAATIIFFVMGIVIGGFAELASEMEKGEKNTDKAKKNSKKTKKNTEQFVTTLLSITASIAVVSACVIGMTKAFHSASAGEIAATFGMLMVISGILLAFTLASSKMKGTEKTVDRFVKTLLSITAAIFIVTSCVAILASIGQEDLTKAGIALAAIAGVLALLTFLSTTVTTGLTAEPILAIAGALSILVISVTLLATAMSSMSGDQITQFIWVLAAITISIMALAATFSALSATAPAIASIGGSFMALGAGILFLGAGVFLIIYSLKMFLSLLKELASTDSKTLSKGIEDMGKIIIAVGKAIAESIAGIFALIPVMIVQFLKSLASYAVDIGQSLLEILASVIGVLADGAAILAEGLARILISIILGIVDALIATAPDIIEKLMVLLETLIIAVADYLYDHGEDLVDAVGYLIVSIILFIGTCIKKLWKAFYDLIVVNFIDAAKDLYDEIIEFKDNVKEKIYNAIVSAIDFIKSLPGRFVEFGKNLILGIIEGIEDAADWLYEKIEDIGDAVLSILPGKWDEHSPSKKFAKIGAFAIEGLVVGIDDKQQSVINAMSNVGEAVLTTASSMADNANETLSSVFSNVGDMFNESDLDSAPTIRPVLDLSDVNAQAGSLASIFNDRSIAVNANAAGRAMQNNQNGVTNADVVNAVDRLRTAIKTLPSGNTYNVNGITYDSGSSMSEAIETLVRAVEIGGRMA